LRSAHQNDSKYKKIIFSKKKLNFLEMKVSDITIILWNIKLLEDSSLSRWLSILEGCYMKEYTKTKVNTTVPFMRKFSLKS